MIAAKKVSKLRRSLRLVPLTAGETLVEPVGENQVLSISLLVCTLQGDHKGPATSHAGGLLFRKHVSAGRSASCLRVLYIKEESIEITV